MDDLKNYFIQFIEKVPSFGKSFICLDDKINHELVKKLQNQNFYTYGLNPKSNFQIKNVNQYREITEFDLLIKLPNKKKIIGCICSGTQLLISAKIVKGKNISGYYSMKDDIINAGANYVDKPAVIDQNIITTAHYKDMGPWMKAVLEQYYKSASR